MCAKCRLTMSTIKTIKKTIKRKQKEKKQNEIDEIEIKIDKYKRKFKRDFQTIGGVE